MGGQQKQQGSGKWGGSGSEKGGEGAEEVSVTQPKVYEERVDVARSCKAGLDLKMSFVIDEMDNGVGTTYGGSPDRIYVISKDGKIHFKGEKGPRGFRPDEAEKSLKQIL